MSRRLACLGVATLLLCFGLMMGGSAGDGYLWWGEREPIYIYGDRAFTRENGVIAGCGTRDNPYIIEAWTITPSTAGFGIYIDHTTRYFVIRNCVVQGARGAAIQFNTVVNGRIEGCQLTCNERAILLENSHYNAVIGNLIAENRYGVTMRAASRNNTMVDNSFIWNGLAAYDPERRNLWYCGTRGNYWFDYDGCDYNRDGIGDRPYAPIGDRYPLICSPMAAALPFCYQSAAHCLVATDVREMGAWQDVDCDGVPDLCVPPWDGPLPPTTCVPPTDPCVPPIGPCVPSQVPCAPSTVPGVTPRPCPPPMGAVPPPEGTVVVNPTTPISLYAQDPGSGVACMYFKVDDGEWIPYGGPFTLSGASGLRTISYYAVDNLGNRSSVSSFTVLLDTAPPETLHRIGEPRVTQQDGVWIPVPPPCDGVDEDSSMDTGAAEAAPVEPTDEPAAEPETQPADDMPAPVETEEAMPVDTEVADPQTPSDTTEE